MYTLKKHLGFTATEVDAKNKKISLFNSNTQQMQEISYDALILASSAPTQSKLNPPEKQWLKKFSTYSSKIVLHDKPYGMPPKLNDWCSWNVTVTNTDKKEQGAQVTYWLSKLQNLKNKSLFVTLNPSCKKISGTIQTFYLDHPCMDKSAISAQKEERDHQGKNGVFHAGAWLRWGFHEDAVFTGILAAKRALEYCDDNMHKSVPLKYVANIPGEFPEFSLVHGEVTHSRLLPIRNAFTYQTESCRFNLCNPPAGFLRKDHFGDPKLSMDTCIRELLLKECDQYFTGPVEVVCNLRFGPFCFNPITVYFVYRGTYDTLRTDSSNDLCAMVCEVHNTPWLERTTYAMLCSKKGDEIYLTPSVHRKKTHVSPFNPCPDTEESYFKFILKAPSANKTVLHVNLLDKEKNAKINVQWKMTKASKTTTTRNMALLLSSAKVLIRIYWQALKLYFKIPTYSKKRNNLCTYVVQYIGHFVQNVFKIIPYKKNK